MCSPPGAPSFNGNPGAPPRATTRVRRFRSSTTALTQWFACEERFGVSPVAHLRNQGWLSPRLSCAHGVWLSPDDMRMLAETGAIVVHNPVSNLRLASGIADVQTMLSVGTAVALGADG